MFWYILTFKWLVIIHFEWAIEFLISYKMHHPPLLLLLWHWLGPKTKNICLIYNLLSEGTKARAIAPEPLNIYLGMQVCYQGQTASTLPPQQSHLPPWGGWAGVIARRQRQEEKREGWEERMQRHCNFFVFLSACIFFTLAQGMDAQCSSRWSVTGATLFFSFFVSCAQRKLSPQASFVTSAQNSNVAQLLPFFSLLISSHLYPQLFVKSSNIQIALCLNDCSVWLRSDTDEACKSVWRLISPPV